MGNTLDTPAGGERRRGCGSFASWVGDETAGAGDGERGPPLTGGAVASAGAHRATETGGEAASSTSASGTSSGRSSKRSSRRGSRGSGSESDGIGRASNPAAAAAERLVSEAKRRGSEAVVDLLRQHPGDQAIQQRALSALLQLCCHEQTTTAQQLSSLGAIELVIGAMTSFPLSQAVQQDGVGLLWSLSANVTDEARVRNGGGVKAVVAAMQAFSMSTVMQHRGCGALFNLSNTVATRGDVAADGAIHVILACFRHHPTAADVMQQACLAINPLADHDGNKAVIAEAGGVALIIGAMRQHAGDEVVQRHGCGALHVLCALNAKNKVLVREAGGIPVVIACMHKHMTSAKLLQRACGVLWNVTCLAMDHEVLTADGWLGHDDLSKRVLHPSSHSPLLMVCYDVVADALVHRAIGPEDLVSQSGHKRMVSFNDPSGVSVAVTDDHVMWARLESWLQQNGDAGASPALQADEEHFSKRSAGHLAEALSSNESLSIRFQSAARNGVQLRKDAPPAPFIDALDLRTGDEVDALLELYGCWMRFGTLDEASQSVRFEPQHPQDVARLVALFARLARVLPGVTSAAHGVHSIAHQAWWSLFSSTHGTVSDAVPPAAVTLDSHSQRLWSCVVRDPLLTRDQLRCILRGLRQPHHAHKPDNDIDDDGGEVITASERFRDEVQELTLLAGYASSIRALDESECEVPSESVAQPAAAASAAAAVRWCVSYSSDASVSVSRAGVSVRSPSPSRAERTWCVNVGHADHLIVTRRKQAVASNSQQDDAHPHAQSYVYSRPLVIGNCNNDANKMAVVSLQGIDALVEAMGTRIEHQGIQREACGALRNLSLLPVNKPLIGRAPVITAVIEAMRHHPADADIQEQASVLLYSVADLPDAIHAIIAYGGVEAVITALRTHAKRPSVLEESLGLLYKLARTGLAQKRDPQREALTLASKSISTHPNHDGVRKYATGMITEWNNPSFAARFAAGAGASASASGQITPAGTAPNSYRGPAHGPSYGGAGGGAGSSSVISSSSSHRPSRVSSGMSTARTHALAGHDPADAYAGVVPPSGGAATAGDKSAARSLRSSRRSTPPSGTTYKV